MGKRTETMKLITACMRIKLRPKNSIEDLEVLLDRLESIAVYDSETARQACEEIIKPMISKISQGLSDEISNDARMWVDARNAVKEISTEDPTIGENVRRILNLFDRVDQLCL